MRFQEEGPQDTGNSNTDAITTELAARKVPPAGETSFLLRHGCCRESVLIRLAMLSYFEEKHSIVITGYSLGAPK